MQHKTFTAQDLAGNVLAGAEVSVMLHGTETPATLFSKQGVALAQPLTTKPDGTFAFSAPDDEYDILVQEADTVASQTIEKVTFQTRVGTVLKVDHHWRPGETHDDLMIERAFNAAQNGQVVKFTPGRTYRVSREHRYLGKSLIVDMTGATVEIADQCVWHWLVMGGESWFDKVPLCSLIGGCLDGRKDHQIYYPNTNGVISRTQAGEEPAGQESAPFHWPNSAVNGTFWDDNWRRGIAPAIMPNGQAYDANQHEIINLNGGGNDGLARIQFCNSAVLDGVTVKDMVRNGIVLWGCDENRILNCRGHGMLPTTFRDLAALHGAGHEASYFSVKGNNPDDLALRGQNPSVIIVENLVTRGGAMPIFLRSNDPKAEVVGSFCSVSKMTATGFRRDVWFETGTKLTISDSYFVGERNSAELGHAQGIFIANGFQDWTVRGCTLFNAPIDPRESQGNISGLVDDCTVIMDIEHQDWAVICHTISNSYVEVPGQGVVCKFAHHTQAKAEVNASIYATQGSTNVVVGGVRHEGTTTEVLMVQDQVAVPLPDAAGINSVRRYNMAVNGGAPFPVKPQDYSLSAGTLTFTYKASPGDVVVVDWYGAHQDQFVLDNGADHVILSEPGGQQYDHITSVIYNPTGAGPSAVPHKSAQIDPANDRYWDFEIGADGKTRINLFNLASPQGDEVTVSYLPPLRPYAGARLHGRGGLRGLHQINCQNTRTTRIGGSVTVTGSVSDIAATAFSVDDDADVVLQGMTAWRMWEGFIKGGSTNAAAINVALRGCDIRDWGMGDATLSDQNRRAFGGNKSSGWDVVGMLDLQGNTWMRTGFNGSASGDVGKNVGGGACRLLRHRDDDFINTDDDGSFDGAVESIRNVELITA